MLTKQGQASFGILQHQAIPKVAAVYAAQHAVVAPPRGAQNLKPKLAQLLCIGFVSGSWESWESWESWRQPSLNGL